MELSTGGYFQALRRIREDDPEIPSRKLYSDPYSDGVAERRGLRNTEDLVRRIVGDLDWIVMMALDKDRSRRYQTVNALVDDLQRHLRDELVVAAQPSVRYRVGKFIRRHRVGFATSTLLFVLVLGFSIVMAMQAARIAEERDRANLEAQTAEQSLDFLVELFEAVRADEGMGDSVTARQILDVGREQLNSRLDDQPLVRARLLDTVGAVYLSLGLSSEAEPGSSKRLWQFGIESLGDLPPKSPKACAASPWSTTIEASIGRPSCFPREALEMLTVSNLPSQRERAETLRILGWALHRQGKYSEAEPVFRASIQTRRAASLDSDVGFARCLFGLAVVLAHQGRHDEAKELLDEALAIFEGQTRLTAYDGAHDPQPQGLCGKGGRSLQRRGKPICERLWRSLRTFSV